jgi:hypothetical protein
MKYKVEDIQYMHGLEIMTTFGKRYVVGPVFFDTCIWVRTVDGEPYRDWHAIDLNDIASCDFYDMIRLTRLFELIRCV